MNPPPADALAEWVRDVFALGDPPAVLTFVGRGAEARVWLIECDERRYAVKQPFEAIQESVLLQEAALLESFARAGIAVPVGLPDSSGRYAATVPESLGGGQLRLTQWVEGDPVVASGDGLASPLGTLLGRLHAAAPPTDEVPGPWYTTVPAPEVWDDLVRRSRDEPWARRLAARCTDLSGLCAVARSAAPARSHVVSHRDLHPENVLRTSAGELVALDWEDVGPIGLDRELAKVLVQWHVEVDAVDEEAVRETVTAYREAGGTGLLRDMDAFATVICTELKFLAGQVSVALDPAAVPETRQHAAAEVMGALDYLPSVAALRRLLEVVVKT